MTKQQELINALFTDGTYDPRKARTGTPEWLHSCAGETISEKVWLHFHERNTCRCGKQTRWVNYNTGYRRYCSQKCFSNSPIELTKRSIRHEHLWATPEWKEKVVLRMELAHHKARTPSKLEKLSLKGIKPIAPIEPGMQKVYQWEHVCGEIFERPFTRVTGIWCPVCHISRGQGEVYEMIRSLYDGPIIVNDRKTIKPYGIDIYLPELKLGIEYHGEYWHPGDGTREVNKVICAAEHGIILIEIWETLWKHKSKEQIAILKAHLRRSDKT